MELIQKLIEKQQEQGLSERAFADQFGITGAHWNQIKSGRRTLGNKTLRGILKKFPELREYVIEYHASDEEPEPALSA